MKGPISIDPARLEEARKAYQDDLRANHTDLIDGEGNQRFVTPFDVAPDGSVSFNRWKNSENKLSAQNTFFNDKEVDAKGNTSWVRRPSWQAFPEYTNDEARDQFDYISKALKNLQGDGFSKMSALYERALGKVS